MPLLGLPGESFREPIVQLNKITRDIDAGVPFREAVGRPGAGSQQDAMHGHCGQEHVAAFGTALVPEFILWQAACGEKLEARFAQRRSEEHTSELQSLMRISYAVFCLKKQKDN